MAAAAVAFASAESTNTDHDPAGVRHKSGQARTHALARTFSSRKKKKKKKATRESRFVPTGLISHGVNCDIIHRDHSRNENCAVDASAASQAVRQ